MGLVSTVLLVAMAANRTRATGVMRVCRHHQNTARAGESRAILPAQKLPDFRAESDALYQRADFRITLINSDTVSSRTGSFVSRHPRA